MNDNIKNLLTETAVGIFALAAIVGICMLFFHSCGGDGTTSHAEKNVSKSQDRARSERLDEFLYVEDDYIYEDKNGVFHADIECSVMELGYLSAHDNPHALYSVRRCEKSKINDWDEFASSNHLCIKCFGNGVLKALKKENHGETGGAY